MSSRFKLKLLNGPLRRREVPLPGGEWRLGGPRSDFAVRLERDAEVVLNIDEAGIELVGTAPYWIGGRRGKYPSGPLPLEVPLDIAGLGVMLGAAESVLPDRRLPKRRSQRGRAISVLVAAGAAVVLSGLIAAAIVVLPPNFSDPPTGSRAVADTVLRELGSDGVKVSLTGTVVTLSGSCERRAQLERAIQVALARGVMVVDHVQCEDDLVSQVSAVMRLYGLDGVSVGPGGPGFVTITGRLSDNPKWMVASRLLANMPGLRGWHVADAAADLTGELTQDLRAAGILDSLTVVRTNATVLVTGQLAPQQRTTLDQIIDSFRNAHPDGPRIIYQDMAPYIPMSQIFSSGLVSIGGDQERAFAVLANGDQYSVGDALPSGYHITAIHADGVDVERDGEFIHAPIQSSIK